jgi:4-hydroxy-tetrahydrodipicolinate reductase
MAESNEQNSIRIGIVGAAGRMGRMLVSLVAADPAATLSGGTEHSGSDLVGQDLGELAGIGCLGQTLADDPVELFAGSDAVIDFTTPAATAAHSELAAQSKAAHIIGTTGLDAGSQGAIERAARHTAVVQAPNMSLGVNLLLALVERAAASFGSDYDIEILEMHHRHKVDAPSGTALALGRAAASGRGVELNEVSRMSREGITGARPQGEIGFATLRGGDVVGEHAVIFAPSSLQPTANAWNWDTRPVHERSLPAAPCGPLIGRGGRHPDFTP